MDTKPTDDKSLDQWIEEYAESHQDPINRFCHTIGIPLITISLGLIPIAVVVWMLGVASPMTAWIGVVMFVAGWVLQFVGHAFEGKPPEFLRDRRFLRIGLLWWFKKMRGKV